MNARTLPTIGVVMTGLGLLVTVIASLLVRDPRTAHAVTAAAGIVSFVGALLIAMTARKQDGGQQ